MKPETTLFDTISYVYSTWNNICHVMHMCMNNFTHFVKMCCNIDIGTTETLSSFDLDNNIQ